MTDFLKCIDGDYTPVENNFEIWRDLYYEFISLRGSKDGGYILKLRKDITGLELRFNIVISCIEVLKQIYSKPLADELKSQGFLLPLDWSNKPQYLNNLNKILSKAKSMLIQADKKKAELKDIEVKYADKKITSEDFENYQPIISKYQGYRIDYNVVSVLEWCKIVNQYEKYIEMKSVEQKPKNAYGKS